MTRVSIWFLIWGLWPAFAATEAGTVRFALVGDIMLGSDYPAKEWASSDPYALLAPSAEILSNADLTMGNLEGAIASPASPVPKKGKNSYAFRMPPPAAVALKQAGFDVLNLANNHSYDAGWSGVMETTNLLMAQGIQSAGIKGVPAFAKAKGLTVAVLGFSPYSLHDHFFDEAGARDLIRRTAAKCDLLVVTMHAGAEGEQALHVPHTNEMYYSENRGDSRRFARLAIDEGAAMVFGHGPHVLRGMEVYKDRLIAYSLGNFVGHKQFNVMGSFGVSCVLEVTLDRKGIFVEGTIHPFVLSASGPTTVDPDRKAVALMQTLSQKDFPQSAPTFLDGGRFSARPSKP